MHRHVVAALVAAEEIALRGDVAAGTIRRVERRDTLIVAELPRTIYSTIPTANGAVLDLGRRSEGTIVVTLRCDNFDTDPPSLAFVAGWDATLELPYAQWPKGPGVVPAHHATGKPFLCRPGVREFHNHIQHGDEPWERYRSYVRPSQLLRQLAHDLRTKQVIQ